MLWKRNEPDPLEIRRRQLEEQQRLLSEQRRQLTEKLLQSGDASDAKRVEPPVWRMEDEDRVPDRNAEPTPARKRNLARQRNRDRVFVFGLVVLLLIVLGILLWVAYVHNTTSSTGA